LSRYTWTSLSRYPGTMLWRLSIQFLAESKSREQKEPVAPTLAVSGRRVHKCPTPALFDSGVQTRSGRSALASRRLIPKVGHFGKGLSNKCNGKLLQMPPSENQTNSGRGSSSCSKASPGTLSALRGSSGL